MKKIFISGASGFIGTKLSRLFLTRGYHVIGVGRSATHTFSTDFDEFEWLSADTTREGKWQDHVAGADIVINLTGQTIFHYWTKKYKQSIYDSRILTTRHIVAAIEKGQTKKLLTTSAAGIYGDSKDEVLTEKNRPGNDFLATVCLDWENEALKAGKKGVSVSVMRFGVVLGDGGALSLMLPAFKCFVGGPLGSGQQWFPWIHAEDLERAVKFLVETQNCEGIFNFTAPTPVQQKEFASILGRVLNRPAIMPAPSFIVRTVMGELGRSLLYSQKVIPKNLMDSGYSFSFPDVESALKDILRK